MTDAFQISKSAVDWMVSCYAAQDLLQLVTADLLLRSRVFKGGFQANIKNIERRPVRRRIARLLIRDANLVMQLIEAPDAPWAYACRAVEALDEDWFLCHWRDVLLGTGDRALVLGMAADERPAIQARGWRLLQRDSWWQQELTVDPNLIPVGLEALVQLGRAQADQEDDRPPAQDFSGRIAALERENQSLKEALDRQRQKTRHAEQTQRDLQNEASVREKDLQRSLQDVTQALRQAQTHVARQVQEEVADFKRRILELPQEEQNIVSDRMGEEENLVARAENVLRKQSELDKKYGSREAVRRRIRQLAEIGRRLATCIEESVRLHPDVRRLHAEVIREADHLQHAIQHEVVDAHTPELAAQLIAEIKGLPADEHARPDFDRIEGLLQNDLVARLLGDSAVARIRQLIDQRRRLIDELLHEAAHPPEQPETESRPREIWNVQAELTLLEDAPLTVYIDGYNVAKRVAELIEEEERKDLAASREMLCDMCRRKAAAFAHLEIVFDGSGALSEREDRDGLTVVFSSGARESQNADDYLVERVHETPADNGQVWLVTDDRGLRNRVLSSCDAFITCRDWYDFLAARQAERP